jgi:hypothetical protein
LRVDEFGGAKVEVLRDGLHVPANVARQAEFV